MEDYRETGERETIIRVDAVEVQHGDDKGQAYECHIEHDPKLLAFSLANMIIAMEEALGPRITGALLSDSLNIFQSLKRDMNVEGSGVKVLKETFEKDGLN